MTENNNQVDQIEEVETPETKTFTEEEVAKRLQSETDKRVSQALATAKAKWESEFQEKLQQEKSEAEKLAKMSEAERNQLQLDQMKQEFENERKQFLREKMELQTVKELSANGLPTEFSKFVLADTAEDVRENIKVLKDAFALAIEQAVEKRLQGTTPKASSQKGVTVTKEQFGKMSYGQRMEIFNANPDLYRELSGK